MSFKMIFYLLAFVSFADARLWGVGDPCPNEIHTTVSGYYGDPPWEPETELKFGTMSTVHSALMNCPNIESLRLRVAGQGCSEWPDRWNFPFDVGGAEKYPPNLQVLSLDGYDFNERRWDEVQPPKQLWYGYPMDTLDVWSWWIQSGKAWKYLKWRSLPEEQRFKRNIDLWVDAMNFSHIHTLSLNPRSRESISNNLTLVLPPKLTNLSSLTIAGQTAHEFILKLPKDSLESLSWLGAKNASSLAPVLEQQGSSLKHLTWYSDELQVFHRPSLSLEQLDQLVSHAPKMQSLVIDMHRNGSWPWDHLRTIASRLPELTNLTLYIDLASDCRRQIPEHGDSCQDGCFGVDQYQQPMLNRTTAFEVAEFLRNHTTSGALKHVKIRSGDWSPSWDGPLYFPPWLESKNAWIDCSVGREADGGGRISCEGQDTVVDNSRSRDCKQYGTVY